MNGSACLEKTYFEDYSDKDCKLISGSSTGVLVCVKGDEYIDVMTGEKIEASRFEELKKSADADHTMFINTYKDATVKLDETSIEADIAFLVGHTVTEEERPPVLF